MKIPNGNDLLFLLNCALTTEFAFMCVNFGWRTFFMLILKVRITFKEIHKMNTNNENNHTSPKVSVIIPIYNAEKFLKKSIDSILDQTYVNFELILVDDGSTDSSADICDEYCKKDCRIKVIHKKNGGVSSAKNIALENIQGEYFCICDSDDYYEKDFLMDGLDFIKRYQTDVFVGGIVEEFWQENTLITKNYYSAKKDFIASPKDIVEKIGVDFAPCIFVGSWVKIYKSDIIKKHRIKHLDLTLGEDFCFNYDILKYANKIYFSSKIYYHYKRINNNSLYTRVNKEIYKVVSTTFDKRKEVTLLHTNDITTLKRIVIDRVINLISCLHKYYDNPTQTTRKEKKLLIKNIAHDPSIKEVKLKQLKNKEHRLLTFLLKFKLCFAIHLVFKTYKFYKNVAKNKAPCYNEKNP